MFTIVGFILMKVSSCSQMDSVPKTMTTTPETKGMTGRCLKTIFETMSEITVATMKSAVAIRSGPPTTPKAGKVSASHSPRILPKKKTSRGPISSANFSIG